ncbi:MAG: hypothetical protein JHC84_05860 [Solirubrobacteraceae bacterium]|nr:hypothetical protein [Solirubrobacteraceae bacterium]
MRDNPRPRHAVGPFLLGLLKPFFRYSAARNAYVLRVAGGQYGPVLVDRDAQLAADPVQPVVLSQPTGRFARADGVDVADNPADTAATQTRQR